MAAPDFRFLYPPLHELQEHLKAELEKNPFFDSHSRDIAGDGRDDSSENGPPDAPPSPNRPDSPA